MNKRQIDKKAHDMMRGMGITDWAHPQTKKLLRSVKAFLITLSALLVLAMPLAAQDTAHVLVPKSMLTAQQINAANSQAQASAVGAWVGIGKEVGEAVNGSLQAISTQAVEFSKTDVGKLTAKIVVIKLLGPMIIHFIGGILVLLLGGATAIWFIRRNGVNRSVLVSKDKDGNEKYDWFEPSAEAKMLNGALLLVIIAISMIVMFSW